MAVHGQDPYTGGQRGQALDGLEELDQEEDGPEHPEAKQHGRDVDRGEPAVAEQADVQHGMVGPELPGRERHQGQRPTTNEVSTRVLVQPWLLPSTSPRTTPSKPVLTPLRPPGRGGPGAAGLGQLPPGQRDQYHADRHVQPEDVLP